MKLVAAVYTLASVAVLTLMVMRPPVQISNTATTATAATAPATVTNQAVNAPAAPATPAAPVATPATDNTAPATPPATSNKPAPDAKAVPDYAREQRLASEISDAIMDGEVVSLNDGTQNFMGILTAAEQPRGAVIILHGRGYHPDWEDVAHPLRTGLAAKGWTTLSLQMPVLEKEAKYYDYVPLFANADKRIDAGIAFLKQKGIAPVVLVAHSCGAHMAMNWINTRGDGDIVAYVGLGMGATDFEQDMAQAFPLDKMKVPVLDVYGEKEYPQVISLAAERQTLMQKAGNSNSKQMVLPEADHYFKDKGEELNAVVANWLNSLPL
ncbi:DUF3530 family protein [Thiothrix unzii]|jgi:pimeloyl-ACP methyl ester carboxylesterase|uniref:DUF3530 family protein n=1 Tax=Thiothrix unzii TaxID=111769 RepID=UPI002A3648F4|nr:DUF3530 family protein [Thiothrix unzii]MDX9989855.1 DUF3530 family protein [Thiothrix unzii]